MTQIISFDLDGTLITSTYADNVWLEGLPTIYAEEKHINVEQAKHILLKEYDTVTDQKKEWYDIAYWFQRYQLKKSWKDLLNQYRHTIEPYPEVLDTIKQLSKYYTLIILSNAKREFINIELEQTHLTPYFTHIFSSTSDFHQVKKVKDFYHMICQRLIIDPTRLIHIGDHTYFDYLIPRSLGIQAYLLDRTNKNSGPRIVHNLNEFKTKITQTDNQH